MTQQSGFQAVISKLVDQHKAKVLLAEKIGLGLVVLGFILLYTLQINYVLPIGGLLLAVIYFLMAFTPLDIEKMQDSRVMDSPGILLFVNKLAFWALSISVMAILFTISGQNGAGIMSFVGGTNIIIILIYWLISRKAINAQVLDRAFALRLLLMLLALSIIAVLTYL